MHIYSAENCDSACTSTLRNNVTVHAHQTTPQSIVTVHAHLLWGVL